MYDSDLTRGPELSSEQSPSACAPIVSVAASPATAHTVAEEHVETPTSRPLQSSHAPQLSVNAVNPEPPSFEVTPPAITVKAEDEQQEDSSCGDACRKVSTKDIQLVQNLIERCLQLYMSQREVVTTLHTQADVEPGFTGLVWQKLEEQNSDFFQAYYTRLKLKDQILLFNHLLDQQVAVVQRMQWSRPMQPAHSIIQQPPGAIDKGFASSVPLPMAASAPLSMFGDLPDLDGLHQSSGLGTSMTAAPASPPLFVNETTHSSGHQGMTHLGHMSSDNLMGLGNPVSHSDGFASDPPIPHVFSMSDIDRHLDFTTADEDVSALDLDDL